jgi:hypothetical protein
MSQCTHNSRARPKFRRTTITWTQSCSYTNRFPDPDPSSARRRPSSETQAGQARQAAGLPSLASPPSELVPECRLFSARPSWSPALQAVASTGVYPAKATIVPGCHRVQRCPAPPALPPIGSASEFSPAFQDECLFYGATPTRTRRGRSEQDCALITSKSVSSLPPLRPCLACPAVWRPRLCLSMSSARRLPSSDPLLPVPSRGARSRKPRRRIRTPARLDWCPASHCHEQGPSGDRMTFPCIRAPPSPSPALPPLPPSHIPHPHLLQRSSVQSPPGLQVALARSASGLSSTSSCAEYLA